MAMFRWKMVSLLRGMWSVFVMTLRGLWLIHSHVSTATTGVKTGEQGRERERVSGYRGPRRSVTRNGREWAEAAEDISNLDTIESKSLCSHIKCSPLNFFCRPTLKRFATLPTTKLYDGSKSIHLTPSHAFLPLMIELVHSQVWHKWSCGLIGTWALQIPGKRVRV